MQKGFSLIVIAVIAVVVMSAVGGYMFLQKKGGVDSKLLVGLWELDDPNYTIPAYLEITENFDICYAWSAPTPELFSCSQYRSYSVKGDEIFASSAAKPSYEWEIRDGKLELKDIGSSIKQIYTRIK